MNWCDLPKGEYVKKRLTDDEMWNAFEWLFSNNSNHDSSYKFIFLKAVINSFSQKDSRGKITFDTVFREFTIISWNLITIYRINQKKRQNDGRITKLEKDIISMIEETAPRIRFEELSSYEQKQVCNRIKNDCKTYVVGALYGATLEYFYSFSKKEEWIEINPQMEKFVFKNKKLIEKLNYYKWADFYQKRNDLECEKRIWNQIGSTFARKDETVFQAVLAYEFERKKEPNEAHSVNNEINTLELLFEAEKHTKEFEKEAFSEHEVEEELYKDFSRMKEYVNDPIRLLEVLKAEKGIV